MTRPFRNGKSQAVHETGKGDRVSSRRLAQPVLKRKLGLLRLAAAELQQMRTEVDPRGVA